MKKQIFLRALLGFPIGISIGYINSIIWSVTLNLGYYAPCTPAFEKLVGNQIDAVILQTVCYAVLGIGFSASSVIWNVERWSLLKQTALYFLINAAVMMPIAWLLGWMEHSPKGFMLYLLIFTQYFAAYFIIVYLIKRRSIRKLNQKLRSSRSK